MEVAAMSVDRIVVIGASSGGIDAVRTLVGALPPKFSAPICVVVHTSPQSPGILPQILDRAGPLSAHSACNGERIRSGSIYVAPPDRHLVIEPGSLRVTKGPKENRFRPAIDPLFRSAAQVYGPAAIGVILTGNLDDGTAGLWAIKQLGGISIVQEPADALFPDMPRSALARVTPDHVVPLAGIPALLVGLVGRPVEDRTMSRPEHIDVEVKIACWRRS
jgi:two-component system, chemotaxis family, protein-glutamate methylesterase/glutaminase